MNALRIFAAVAAGFLIMVTWVLGMTVASVMFLEPGFIRGADPSSPSVGFLVLNIGMSFVGAVVGGGAAAIIGGPRRARAVNLLAGVVLALGIIFGTGRTAEQDAVAPGGGVREPTWYAWTIPFLGAAGVIAGGALMRRRMGR